MVDEAYSELGHTNMGKYSFTHQYFPFAEFRGRDAARVFIQELREFLPELREFEESVGILPKPKEEIACG